MNGAGNAIVVMDLRGADLVPGAADARAIAAAPGLAFDQLMTIHDPVSAGTDAFLRIYNVDGSLSGACGNGTRCVAWLMLRDARPRCPGAGDLGRQARLPPRRPVAIFRRHGAPGLRLGADPATLGCR